jgi:hypothetical protein
MIDGQISCLTDGILASMPILRREFNATLEKIAMQTPKLARFFRNAGNQAGGFIQKLLHSHDVLSGLAIWHDWEVAMLICLFNAALQIGSHPRALYLAASMGPAHERGKSAQILRVKAEAMRGQVI